MKGPASRTLGMRPCLAPGDRDRGRRSLQPCRLLWVRWVGRFGSVCFGSIRLNSVQSNAVQFNSNQFNSAQLNWIQFSLAQLSSVVLRLIQFRMLSGRDEREEAEDKEVLRSRRRRRRTARGRCVQLAKRFRWLFPCTGSVEPRSITRAAAPTPDASSARRFCGIPTAAGSTSTAASSTHRRHAPGRRCSE